MSDDFHPLTRQAYEDPDIVAGYVKEHSISSKMPQSARQKFLSSLPGHRIIDLGCGPGHDSYAFAELGADVTGVDLSLAMINAAKSLKKPQAACQPKFVVGNLLHLDSFSATSFDGIWACASLVHLTADQLPQALQEIFRLLAPHGKAFIAIKGGDQITQLVEENKYGPTMRRQFTFWHPDYFSNQLKNTGFIIETLETQNATRPGKAQTTWLNYWVAKP